MKTIVINSLELTNFKGIQNLKMSFGEHTDIRGDNGTGKTTLFDAFLWLLFGKDSAGKSDFAIKTVTTQGDEIPQLDHTVTGVLIVDGNEITLERTYKEVWTKKRGSHSPSFTGHETSYSVDGVPVQAKDYKAKIDSIIPEDTFRLLTSPAHFSSLPWQKRRELLMSMCGDLSDADIIAGDNSLSKLPEILGNYTLEEKKKVIAASKKRINDRLAELPARIDELQKTVVNIGVMRSEAELKSDIEALEHQLKSAETGNTAAAKAIETAHKAEQYKLTKLHENERVKRVREIGIRDYENEIRNAESGRAQNLRTRSDIKARLNKLAADYKEAVAVSPVDSNCPCCGQPLPPAQIAEAKAKANEIRAARLKTINEDGERTHEELKLITESIENWDKELARLNSELKEFKAMPVAEWKPESDPEYQKLISADSGGVDNSEAVKAIKERLESVRAELAKVQGTANTGKRIEDLKEELKTCHVEFESLEEQLYLLERFTVSKVNLLEERINGMFRLARFKLFDTQINGGIQECCTILYNGVPYGAGLNKSAEINVGLDIIATLSGHYGVKAPVWVDNAEAVVKLYELETQTIRLIVDGKVNKLEVA